MTDSITSLQNPRVKLIEQLQKRSHSRRKERKIVLEGTRLILDATQQGHIAEFFLYEPKAVNYPLLATLQNTPAILYSTTAEILKQISATDNPQGIIGVYPLPRPPLPNQAERVLIMDAVREPGNLGTMLRTAAAAGVEVVILAPDCVDPYNPKVLRAGMGAHFRLPIVEATWKEIANYCQSLRVYLAAGDGEQRYSAVDWTSGWALVIGNEAHGVGHEVGILNAQRIAIPMEFATESLNAALAAGVILFEAQRQRLGNA